MLNETKPYERWIKPTKSGKPPSEHAHQKARKAQTAFMGRSLSAYNLLQERAKHDFSLDHFRRRVEVAIGKPCRYCKEEIKAKTFSPDHRIPLSRGGEATARNIDIVCLKCNHAKGMLTDEEYSALLDLIRPWDVAAQNDVRGRLRLGAAAKGRIGRRWGRKA